MLRIAGFLLLPFLAAAQLTPNSVTVTSSRVSTLPYDHTRFSLSVDSDLDASLDEVLAAVDGSGLTAEDFTGVSYYAYPSATETRKVRWLFGLTVPAAKMRTTIVLLAGVQQNVAKDGKFALEFRVEGVTVAPQALQSQTCSLSELIADARAQATKLASAAGLSVGAIQAMSSPTIHAPASSWYSSTSTAVCSLTARFSLGGL